MDDVAAVVDRATPDAATTSDVSAVPSSDGSFASSTGDISVEIPKSNDDGVLATKQTSDGSVTVTVGTGADSSSAGILAPDGSVVYDGASTTSQTVQPTEDGFRIHTVINDAAGDTEFVHPVSLPVGARLMAEKDMPQAADIPAEAGSTGGAVFVVDAGGAVLGGFSAPWAKDANGNDVPTRFSIRSGAIVQEVDHRASGVAYPVVADPYFGFDLIKSATWRWHSGDGWTLEVTPTSWARWNAGGYLPGVYGWDELYSKYRNRGLNRNLAGMRDQYICHQQIVALRAPNKPTWNLDEWRPSVGYLQTVNAQCNPGGKRFFD
ncbi:DUF2599 domain-containing protein [Tersicoccus sp. MR15.9]|uniref:DUF2599 domain-containing protein n=1 Tax=Tersicoccus mangrovi TaxID=3121635 RepID=UPI002FE6016F